MASKHTVDYHPSPSQFFSRIHAVIFLWACKGFISPKSFLNFFLNFYLYSTMFVRNLIVYLIVLRLLQIHLWVKKLNLFFFNHALKKNSPPGFYYYLPGRREFPIPPEQCVLKIFFPEEKGERGLWSGKNYQNQKRYRSQDKFHHLCNL